MSILDRDGKPCVNVMMFEKTDDDRGTGGRKASSSSSAKGKRKAGDNKDMDDEIPF